MASISAGADAAMTNEVPSVSGTEGEQGIFQHNVRAWLDTLARGGAAFSQTLGDAGVVAKMKLQEPYNTYCARQSEAAAAICALPEAVSGAVEAAAPGFQITVTRPEMITQGVNSYTIYTISKRVGGVVQVTARRRYKDFEWLCAELWKESCAGTIVPALPGKKFLWKVNDVTVEMRRRALQNFLMRVAVHPTLSDCQSFKTFLEADDELTHLFRGKPFEGIHKSICAFSPSVVSSVASLLPTYGGEKGERDELDKKMDAAKVDVATFLVNIGSVAKHLPTLVKGSKAYADDLRFFGAAVEQLGEGLSDSVNDSLVKLGATAGSESTCINDFALKELLYLEMPFEFYMQMISSVQQAIANQEESACAYERALAYAESSRARSEKLKRVAAAACKLLEAERTAIEEKAAAAADDVENCVRAADEAKKASQLTTELFLVEFDRFKKDWASDLKKIASDYRQLQLELHKPRGLVWEKVIV